MPTEAVAPPQPLVRALRRLLRPLVRVLIAHNLGFPYLCNLLKGVYVEAASLHFRLEQGRLTDSRLSVLTGVHRKDVKRLREEPRALEAAPRTVSPGARIIGLWTGSPEYLDELGQPRVLSRTEFDALVESVSKDVRSRTIFDEWQRQGLVELTDQDRVRLCADAFVPSSQFEELAYFFGRNLHDHISTAGANLMGIDPPRLERAVYYGGLRPESAATLEALAREHAMEALQALNKATLERIEADKGHPEAMHRFCFGAYIYSGKEDAEANP